MKKILTLGIVFALAIATFVGIGMSSAAKVKAASVTPVTILNGEHSNLIGNEDSSDALPKISGNGTLAIIINNENVGTVVFSNSKKSVTIELTKDVDVILRWQNTGKDKGYWYEDINKAGMYQLANGADVNMLWIMNGQKSIINKIDDSDKTTWTENQIEYNRYRAYVHLWNDIYLAVGSNSYWGQILSSEGGLDHYHALLGAYNAEYLPPYFAFADYNFGEDTWADALEVGLWNADVFAKAVELGFVSENDTNLVEYVTAFNYVLADRA